ncbi:hypothetical protein J4230_02740 [Candidatus Woesearchaeota archaeon]|nr:hypothetical protein [Candidatus Woesearchaeota archaeon]
MKKFVICILAVLLFVNYVYAIPFATIATTGLNFLGPGGAELSTLVNTAVTAAGCFTSLALCVEGQITGKISGEIYGKALESIAKSSPDAAKAIITYQQVKGYAQQGAEIINELKVDNYGYVESGSIKFKSDSEIGNFIGKDISKEDIVVANAQFSKENGITTLTIEEGGRLDIKDKAIGKTRVYSNIAKGGVFKLNEKGEITEADITSNDKGSQFSFGDKLIDVKPNTRVVYRNGQIVVYGKEKSFTLSSSLNEKDKGSNIKIIDGDSVTINGNEIIGVGFQGEDFKVAGLNGGFGRVVLNDGRIITIGKGTDAVVQGIQHKVSGSSLNVYHDKDFDPSLHSDENYFNYGENKIFLGGNGFTSSLREGNKIFPEYIQNEYEGSHAEREARLEFTPQDGNLEISRLSQANRPLALGINSDGKFIVNNGRWKLEADGSNIYNKIEKKPHYALAYDMNFNYVGQDGITKKYVLDQSTSYAGGPTKRGFIKGKGFFGQVISSDDGNSQVSFPEYIEGFPVIPNAKTFYYYDKKGNKLEKPRPSKFEANKKILDYIPESKYADCSGAVQTIYANYQFQDMVDGNRESVRLKIENGRTLEYKNDGSYTIWDTKLKKIVTKKDDNLGDSYQKWLTNVQAYSDSGTLQSYYKRVNSLKSLKPGDVIAMIYGDENPGGKIAGHTKIVKQVISIDGNIYYSVYGGSTPAHTVREEGDLESPYTLGLEIDIAGNTKIIRFEEDKLKPELVASR